jgi:hypothetical protein
MNNKLIVNKKVKKHVQGSFLIVIKKYLFFAKTNSQVHLQSACSYPQRHKTLK